MRIYRAVTLKIRVRTEFLPMRPDNVTDRRGNRISRALISFEPHPKMAKIGARSLTGALSWVTDLIGTLNEVGALTIFFGWVLNAQGYLSPEFVILMIPSG